MTREEIDYSKISSNKEVIKLLKKRKEIEDRIFSIEKEALIKYELQLLSID